LDRSPEHVSVAGEIRRWSGDHLSRYIHCWERLSVVKYEKNKNRMSLTDASLEGILHAKQYRRMHSLKV
jgi:hypothetical protein